MILDVDGLATEVRVGPQPAAGRLAAELSRLYRATDSTPTMTVAIGGDGFMLRCAQEQLTRPTAPPLFGLHTGRVGFLMNPVGNPEQLADRLRVAEQQHLRPLRADIHTVTGDRTILHGLNDVVCSRAAGQAAHLRVTVDGTVRVGSLSGDGILVSTAAGSTAYNLSAHGPIIPLGSPLLALTPICAHRPRRWPGALLPDNACVEIDALDIDHRPVLVTVDQNEVRAVNRVVVCVDGTVSARLAFDPDHNLSDRVVAEQFRL